MPSPTAFPAGRALAPGRLRPILVAVGLAVVALYVEALGRGWLEGDYLFMTGRGGRQTDFLAFWIAGKMAFAGEAAAAYDWERNRAETLAAFGAARGQAWLSPPSFLLVVAPFALLGYAYAKVAWLAATLFALVAAARGIVGRPWAALAALAFPAVPLTCISGQTGFLTAALAGGALLWLRPRPWLAGICLGLLTVKPQLGLLFPLALAAGSCWTTLLAASLTAAALVVASAIAFGPGAWIAFADALPRAGEAILQGGLTGWGKVQSVYGVLRHLGADATFAWSGQALFGGLVALGAVLLWRSRAAFEVKAAALGVGAVLVQPYVFIYDETMLLVPIAFLLRLGLRTRIATVEIVGYVLASCLLLAVLAANANLGFAAALVVAALVARRAAEELGRPLDAPRASAHNVAAA